MPVVALPYSLELLAILQAKLPDPLVKAAWIAQSHTNALLSPVVVQNVLVLGVAEVAENVLGVFRGLAGPVLCFSERNYVGAGSYLVQPKHLHQVLSIIIADLQQSITLGRCLRLRLLFGSLHFDHFILDREQFVRSDANPMVQRSPHLQIQAEYRIVSLQH